MILNLRDLGGCRTAGGRGVVRGRLWRSAEPDLGPGSEAPRLLQDLGVGRVIDLRTQAEVEASTGSQPSSFLERLHIPFVESVAQRQFQPVDRSPPATAQRYYDLLLEGRTAVATVLDRLTEARSRPTLVHCASGRDRTGIVIALVLELLDVPDEEIARDYAESRVMNDAEGRHAHPDNILHLLRIARERHGSVEAMMGYGNGGRALEPLEHAMLEL